MKKWYYILLGVVLIALVGSWIHSFWPTVPVATRYEALNEVALEQAEKYEGINQSQAGSVPEYERLQSISHTIFLNTIMTIDNNEDINNVTGKLNFLTKEFISPNETIAYEIKDNEVVAKDQDSDILDGVLNVAYANAKENQAEIRNNNFTILLSSLRVFVLLIIGILDFKFAEEISRFSVRLTIKDAEPSEFYIFTTKVGGIFLILVSLYFASMYMSMF